MSDIGEMVAIALDARHTKDTCYFCRGKEEGDENGLEAQEEEDDVAEDEAANYQPNHSGMLGRNLLGGGSVLASTLRVRGNDSMLLPGAHHLIPGNASLRDSNVKKYLGTNTGKDPKNVGYNVNHSANGAWLPANYAVRPWKGREDRFKMAYAFLAMRDMGSQFHDAHPTYSGIVRRALNACAAKTKFLKKVACPECDAGAGKDDPPYAIVARLNAISGWLSDKLTGDPLKWRVQTLFTSQWAVTYQAFLKAAGKKKADQLLDKLEKQDVSAEIQALIPGL